MFSQAFKQLKLLKCLESDGSLSHLGREISILPTDPVFSFLLLTSLKPKYASITEHIITIVSLLSVENIFYLP
jgi:HrpA-like RNA helicase